MNELMIIVNKVGWMYFKTERNNANDAFLDFRSSCGKIGLNMDNIDFDYAVLRNEDGDDIDVIIL